MRPTANTTTPAKSAKPPTLGTSTDQKETLRSETSGRSKSSEPPTRKQAMPIAKSTPKDGTKTSIATSPTPSSISSSPTQEKGRIWKEMAAITRQTTPITPGSVMPGCWNSM